MRFTQSALLAAVLLPGIAAFAPPVSSSSSHPFIASSTKLAQATTVEPPTLQAPGAGHVPAWENRKGKSPEEFLKSDLSKEDLSGMWECPLTRWNSEGYVRYTVYSDGSDYTCMYIIHSLFLSIFFNILLSPIL
jgi:hypothetical protein